MHPTLSGQSLNAEQVEILEVHGALAHLLRNVLSHSACSERVVWEKKEQQGILRFSCRNMIYQSSGCALRGQKHHLVFSTVWGAMRKEELVRKLMGQPEEESLENNELSNFFLTTQPLGLSGYMAISVVEFEKKIELLHSACVFSQR